MPELNSAVIAFLTVIANVVVQSVKGPLPEKVKAYIPITLMVLMSIVGSLIALAYSRDVIAGLIEGLLAGASAAGIYQAAAVVPGVRSILNKSGWFGGPTNDAG